THEKQFDRYQKQPDAQPGAKWNAECRQGIAFESRERSARVRDSINPDAEPGDAVRTKNAENRAKENDNHSAEEFMLQTQEIIKHAHRDQNPEDGQTLSLGEKI